MPIINLATYRTFNGTPSSGAYTLQTENCTNGFTVTVVLYDTVANAVVNVLNANTISAVKIVNNCTQDYSIVQGDKIAIENYLNACCVGVGAMVNFIDIDKDADGFCISNKFQYGKGYTLDLSAYGGASLFIPTSDNDIVAAFAALNINVVVNGCGLYFPIDFNGTITDIEVNKLDLPVAKQTITNNGNGTFTLTQTGSTVDPLATLTGMDDTITWTDSSLVTKSVTFSTLTDPNILGITWTSSGLWNIDVLAFLLGQNSTISGNFTISKTIADSFAQTDSTLSTDGIDEKPITISGFRTGNFVDTNNDAFGFISGGSIDYNVVKKIDLTPYGGSASISVTNDADIIAAFAALGINVAIINGQLVFDNTYTGTVFNVEVNGYNKPIARQTITNNGNGTYTVDQTSSMVDSSLTLSSMVDTISWTDASSGLLSVSFSVLTSPNIVGVTWTSSGIWTLNPLAFLVGQNSTISGNFTISKEITDSFAQTDTTLVSDGVNEVPIGVTGFRTGNFVDLDNDVLGWLNAGAINYTIAKTMDLTPYGGTSGVAITSNADIIAAFAALSINVAVVNGQLVYSSTYTGTIFDVELNGCPTFTFTITGDDRFNTNGGISRASYSLNVASEVSWLNDGNYVSVPAGLNISPNYADNLPKTIKVKCCIAPTDLSFYNGNYNVSGFDISNLTALTYLNFYGNQFSGVIPNDLFALNTALTYLNFSYNQFSGVIPNDLFALNTALSYLEFRNNQFSGAIPNDLFATNTALSYLDFANNQFSGAIPNDLFANNTALTNLNFAYNQFIGVIPNDLFINNTNLVYLIFYGNPFSGTIPNDLFATNTALTYLNFYSNQFSGAIPNDLFATNTALTYLYFNTNQFSGAIPSDLFINNTALTNLYFFDNNFSGTIPSDLFIANTALKTLDYNANGFNGKVNYANTPNLVYHNISNSNYTVTNINDTLVDILANCSAIITLYMVNQVPLAPPTGSGLTAKNTLIANGVTVITD